MSPTPARLRDERGFMLIEVLVSAVILVTASLAIFATLTQADSAAGNQQVRVEAANFAQSELERIRSLPVEDIQAFAAQGTRTVTRNHINFTENVVAKWVSDGGDEPQCTGQDGGLDYMRTTVSIAWPGMGSIRPVSLTSLFTPNAGAGGTTGSLSVHVIDRDGNPQPNIPISIKGENAGGSYSGSTNQNGCVVFGFIPQDTYDLTGSKTGYVDQDSKPIITDNPQVAATETTKVEYSYDSAGWTGVSYNTTWANTLNLLGLGIPLTPVTVKSYPQHLQLWNAGQTAPGGVDVDFPGNAWPGVPTIPLPTTYPNPVKYPTFLDSNSTQNSWNQPNGSASVPLFPFATPYSIYPGTCPANAIQGANAQLVNIPRGAYQNTGAENIEALQVIVRDGSNAAPTALNQGNLVSGARVMVSFGCPGAWTRITASGTGTPTASSPNLSPWGPGTLADPGFPYSPIIRVCAWEPPSATYKNGRYSITYGAVNTDPTKTNNVLTVYTGASGYTTTPPAGAAIGSCMAS